VSYIYNPRLDCAKEQVVGFMSFANNGVMVDHPLEFNPREVCGELNSSAVETLLSTPHLNENNTDSSLSSLTPASPFLPFRPTSLSFFSKKAT
jgi:hypothetical protein